MWKELRDINEMFTPVKERKVIDDSDVIKFAKNRVRKQYFNEIIDKYLRENHIWIENLSKKDINILGKKYNDKDREVLIQQIMFTLETRFGKPLKRIKDNKKSALFEEIDNDGRSNSRTEETSWDAWEGWSISVTEQDDWWTSWWD